MSKEDTVSDFADGYAGDWLPHKSSCKCEECSRERQIKAMAKDIRDLKVERGYLLFRLSAARERIAELEAAESREAALLDYLEKRMQEHVKYIQTSENPPNGYAAVLIPDWWVKQRLTEREAALAPDSKHGD